MSNTLKLHLKSICQLSSQSISDHIDEALDNKFFFLLNIFNHLRKVDRGYTDMKLISSYIGYPMLFVVLCDIHQSQIYIE